MKIDQVQPAELILDFDFYPRHRVDTTHVNSLRDAREAGVELPAIIVDRKTKKVIDGFHRLTDALRAKLETIAVEWREYRREADMLEDAIRLNAPHGRKLDPYDKARCTILAEKFHLSKERLASALSLTIYKVEDLRLRKTAIAPNEEGLTPIKGTLHELAGDELSARQVEGNKTAGGMRPLYYVNQVINLLENDLVDKDNERLMSRLALLRGLLVTFLKK